MRAVPSWARETPSPGQEFHEKVQKKMMEDVRRERMHTRGYADLPLDQDAARQELTDEQRYPRMPSKHGRRWKAVAAIDADIERIQGEQERLRSQGAILHARIPAAEQADVQALANWHENGQHGPRPEPTKDVLELERERLAQDQTALDRLIDDLLDKKEEHVQKHRGRLEREAGADVERAHERYGTLVRELERARDELVEARRTRRWARLFPEEAANRDEIITAHVAGGLLQPVKRTLGTSAQVPFQALLDALHADADVLRDGLPGADRDGLDIRRDAVWMNTAEGQQAMTDEKKRILEELRKQNATHTGWEE
jgi:hypothetical protein